MLDLLDTLLRDFLLAQVPSLAPMSGQPVNETQVSSSPPDETWRSTLGDPGSPGLNVYLVELRENVRLRSLERTERREGSNHFTTRFPYRVDCHYLISAYASALPTNQPSPTQWEHQLLHDATRSLARNRYLKASEFYPPGTTELNSWPEHIRDHELPIEVNPAAGFPKLAEFWGTMPGATHPWRPVVYLIVTIPIEMAEARPVEMVRHAIVNYTQLGLTDERGRETKEALEEIGGVVLDDAGKPVAGAWVILEDANQRRLARTTSDAEGKFIISLMPSAGVLYAAAFGLGQSERIHDVAEPQRSDYTLQFR